MTQDGARFAWHSHSWLPARRRRVRLCFLESKNRLRTGKSACATETILARRTARMKMSTFLSIVNAIAKHWRSVAIAALLCAGALIGYEWFAAHRSAAALSATLAASQQQITAAAADEKTRDAQLATQLAQISALEQKVQTPKQALAALPGALPPLPLPITLSSVPPSLASANAQSAGAGTQSASAPSAAPSAGAHAAASPGASGAGSNAAAAVPSTLAPIVANIPQADLKPLYYYLENCQATTLDDTTARKDLTDEQTEVTALTQQRDAAVSSAKGGAFWTRFRRGAKWFAIGAATGAIAGAVAAHR
jgi:hypothetical protein